MNYVYILRCKDDTFYCGWTTDLTERIAAHNSGKGAKYTRSRRPVELVYYGMIMLYLNYIGKVDGPYPFFRVRNQRVRATVLWVRILLVAVAAISAVVCAIAR